MQNPWDGTCSFVSVGRLGDLIERLPGNAEEKSVIKTDDSKEIKTMANIEGQQSLLHGLVLERVEGDATREVSSITTPECQG
eukprot:1319257-Amorphochlora_amoeboformis.AAC.3